MQPETKFKNIFRKHLDEIPESFFFKMQLVSLRGVPDYLGVVRGRMVALELKVGKNKEDALQGWTLNKLARCGAFVAIVRPENFREVLKQLGEL